MHLSPHVLCHRVLNVSPCSDYATTHQVAPGVESKVVMLNTHLVILYNNFDCDYIFGHQVQKCISTKGSVNLRVNSVSNCV